MQPRCRQVPPTFSFSTTAMLRPASPPRSAAAYPAGPPPMMTTSNCWAVGTTSLGAASNVGPNRRGPVTPAGFGPGFPLRLGPGSGGWEHASDRPVRSRGGRLPRCFPSSSTSAPPAPWRRHRERPKRAQCRRRRTTCSPAPSRDDSFWANPDNPTVNVDQDHRRAGRCRPRFLGGVSVSRRTFGPWRARFAPETTLWRRETPGTRAGPAQLCGATPAGSAHPDAATGRAAGTPDRPRPGKVVPSSHAGELGTTGLRGRLTGRRPSSSDRSGNAGQGAYISRWIQVPAPPRPTIS